LSGDEEADAGAWLRQELGQVHWVKCLAFGNCSLAQVQHLCELVVKPVGEGGLLTSLPSRKVSSPTKVSKLTHATRWDFQIEAKPQEEEPEDPEETKD